MTCPRMTEWSQSSEGQHDPFTWFRKFQLQSVIRDGLVPEWFHGIISRKTAEELLMPKPTGYFLIRVSESRIGYTLSHRSEDRCRHFMIDVLEDGQYIIVGENRRHRFLQDLVDFHRRTPIMPFNQVLTVACGQSQNNNTNYAELLFPRRHPNSAAVLPPNSYMPPDTRHPVEQDDIPPAVPSRPNHLKTSVVPSPNSQQNMLYPDLKDEPHHVPSPIPDKPVPKTRRKYPADNLPLNQPPEVPSRSCVPQRLNQACIRTISAPEAPHTPPTSELKPCTNDDPVKVQEAKLSVVSNLKNLKKRLQKKKCPSKDTDYAEINLEVSEKSEDTENEYQEIREDQPFNAAPHFYNPMRLTEEYLPPPPFAPGY
ncbi:hematopoietic SH2 domain-containing protein homolog [Cololabis saira]|uniref:hematopoietic SH2 domain-containing protein homolog n=1 Tax=Cololabis saira TaxID=129043 RepID=UPI002AD2855B|nr:hematopoietic SH2 domain-containing protein homolog [Cololabis saira]